MDEAIDKFEPFPWVLMPQLDNKKLAGLPKSKARDPALQVLLLLFVKDYFSC